MASLSKVISRQPYRTGRVLVPSSSSSSFCSSSAAAIPETPPPPPSSSPAQAQGNEKERGRGWSKWFLFLPGAITFGLGTWQILRRQDKIKTLEYRQSRLAMEPMKLTNVSPSSEQLDALEFRKVACKGVFDEKRSVYVGPRSRSISGVTENGYYVITPLMPIRNHPESLLAFSPANFSFFLSASSVQSPILVNRGWVPRSWKESSLEASLEGEQTPDKAIPPTQATEQGSRWRFWSKKPKVIEDQRPSVAPMEVIGVIRGSEKPSIFVPENDPKSRQWFYVDVPAIARSCGLPENTIYVEDINENVNSGCPYPVPKDVNTLIRSSVMPRDHLNYTLTWYSLSAAVTFMAFKRVRPKKTRR
ncbi:Surfeit locus protein 1 [Turnera subulata]|uniref:SURF1-like protein n=1 Tax=Turnera subulata TaxID=218843 RepID=A0A9Q0G0P1_9ROSI|nr:Surfeit locus protein 1 [Turnera subulata]